jgi:hypothetical protein
MPENPLASGVAQRSLAPAASQARHLQLAPARSDMIDSGKYAGPGQR